jgi:putative Holliday junction resolvase
MRYLAIDYGSKRIGLACGEDGLGVAIPIAPILHFPPWTALAQIIGTRGIDALVLGHPLNLDGWVGSWARQVESFGQQLQKRFGLPVYLSDERLTTYGARRDLESYGRRPCLGRLRRERHSGLIDSRAAALLLQDFFDERCSPLPGGGR